VSLKERFKEAKENKTFIVEKSYISELPVWDTVLKFIYDQTSEEDLEKENKKVFEQILPDLKIINTVHGNIVVQDPLWIKSLTGKAWEDIVELKTFLYKLNKDFGIDSGFENCSYYNGTVHRPCNCNSIWHSDGLVVSLAVKHISDHKDVFDAAYVQLIGKSFWKIDGDQNNIVVLNPGDLLLLPNELAHEVWGEGPRVGVLLNKKGTHKKPDTRIS
jgi:hypothetical protein